MFKALVDKPLIIPACNIRIPFTAHVIFKAAKDTNSPLIIEIAKAECNLSDGYIGINIDEFASRMKQIAAEVEFDAWSLHADHISVKTGTLEPVCPRSSRYAHQYPVARTRNLWRRTGLYRGTQQGAVS